MVKFIKFAVTQVFSINCHNKDCETHYRGEGLIRFAREWYTLQVTFQITLIFKNVNPIYFEPVVISFNMLLNVQSGRVVRALELSLITSKGQRSNPLCGTYKFHSMDIVKLDAVQLYKYQRSNKVVGALVLWVVCRKPITLEQSELWQWIGLGKTLTGYNFFELSLVKLEHLNGDFRILSISISQYLNNSISQYLNISISQYFNISISQFLNFSISQYLNISIFKRWFSYFITCHFLPS